MFVKNNLYGVNDGIGYEIVFPVTDNEYIHKTIEELLEDIKYYFESSFGRRLKNGLVKHKRGRAYCELYVTHDGDEYFSFVILMAGFDGNELILFEYIPVTLNKFGLMVPLCLITNCSKRKNRPYFLTGENTVCLPEECEAPRIKIGKTELFGLIRYRSLI